MENPLVTLSDEMAAAVERASRSVAAVHARPRVSSSGIVWKPGVVVTAEHTIRRDEEIRVTLPDGRTVAAELAGRDPGSDLAVLKVEAETPETRFAAADGLRAGNIVLAVGRSEETGANATMGVVSALSGAWRTWRGGLIDRFIRLDIALYPGLSGGAVVGTDGRIVALATSGLSRTSAVAVPVSTVSRIAEELLSKGHVTRGYLGIGLQPLTLPEHLRSRLGRAEAGGVILLSVEQNGPADKAGLMVGDVLLAIEGKSVTDTDDVQAVLGAEYVGREVKALILRGGALTERSITVGERPSRRD